jgi:prohibitin 1
MKYLKIFFTIIMTLMLLESCVIVRPGEIGVDVHFGKTKSKSLKPGPHHFFAIFGRKIVRFDSRVTNYSQSLNFHTQEGIEVTSQITILYHIIPDSTVSIYRQLGTDYQEIVIEDNLTTILRQTGLNYKATELITERTAIENTVKNNMETVVGKYGFAIDLVMLKEIDLPTNITRTIEAKLNAEETAKKTKIDNEILRNQLDFQLEKDMKEAKLEIEVQRITIDFSIEKQKKEAERLLIEAEAIKEQQQIINSTLTDRLIKYKSLEITRDLVKSKNTKVIVTDGTSPVILNEK